MAASCSGRTPGCGDPVYCGPQFGAEPVHVTHAIRLVGVEMDAVPREVADEPIDLVVLQEVADQAADMGPYLGLGVVEQVRALQQPLGQQLVFRSTAVQGRHPQRREQLNAIGGPVRS